MSRSPLKIKFVNVNGNGSRPAALRSRLATWSLTIAMAITLPASGGDLSAQEFSKPSITENSSSTVPATTSDLYFRESDSVNVVKALSPRRDARSITPPSIPIAMQEASNKVRPEAREPATVSSNRWNGQPIYRTASLQQSMDSPAPPFVEQTNNSTAPADPGSFIPRIENSLSASGTGSQSSAPVLSAPVFQAPFQRSPGPTHYDPARLSKISGTTPTESYSPNAIAADGEPDLELPSNLQMADSHSLRQVEVQSREMFWDQFSTMPAGDKKSRTEGYDSLPAILNNGFWFGGVDIMFIEPLFQGNYAITTSDGSSSSPVPADYNFDAAWKGYFGFETNAGPAVKASFFRYNEFSGLVSFVADGTTTGESIVHSGDPANVFRLAATNVGDRIDTRQQIKLNSMDLMFYKDQKNPVSRVRGNVGLRFLSLQQFLFADLFEAAGPVTSLRSVNDYQAMGPKLGIEYFRPIGHTDLELQSGLFGSLMFGRRDHVVTDVGNLQVRQFGKMEPLSIFEMYLGVQWNFQIARCQTAFVRTAIESQYWSGGESPTETGTDFGFYGLTAGFGIKR